MHACVHASHSARPAYLFSCDEGAGFRGTYPSMSRLWQSLCNSVILMAHLLAACLHAPRYACIVYYMQACVQCHHSPAMPLPAHRAAPSCVHPHPRKHTGSILTHATSSTCRAGQGLVRHRAAAAHMRMAACMLGRMQCLKLLAWPILWLQGALALCSHLQALIRIAEGAIPSSCCPPPSSQSQWHFSQWPRLILE